MVALLACLWACGGGAAEERAGVARQDAQGLQEALRLANRDLAAAAARCGQLAEPARRDLCRVTLLERATEPAAAEALCPQIGDPLWAEECRFQVLMMLAEQVDPVTMTQRCYREVPTFGRHCMGHAETAWTSPEGPQWFRADVLEAQLDAIRAAVPPDDRPRVDLLRPRAQAAAAPPPATPPPAGDALPEEAWWLR